jgi:hypothetical protein
VLVVMASVEGCVLFVYLLECWRGGLEAEDCDERWESG